MKKDKKTAVIYARYSSERQTEQSIDGQIHVCSISERLSITGKPNALPLSENLIATFSLST